MPPGTEVVRGAPGPAGGLGRLVSITNVVTNAAARDIRGLDLRAQYNQDFDIGTVNAQLEWSRFLTYDVQNSADENVIDFITEAGYPENRLNATVRLTRDAFTVNYAMNYIGVHGDGEISDYGDYMTHDVTFEYRSQWDVDLILGVQNFTDEKPIIDAIGAYNDSITGELYDLAGRRYFARLQYNFY